MILGESTNQNAHQVADDLLRQVAIIEEHVAYLREVASRVRSMEQRFSLSSDQIHAAIDAGALEETNDVCNWIMDYELLRQSGLAEIERPARVE